MSVLKNINEKSYVNKKVGKNVLFIILTVKNESISIFK